VVVDVDNPEQILMPGMTAYVSIAVAERKGVLLVPNAALRFKPANGDQPKAPGNGAKPKDEKSGKLRDTFSGKVYVLKDGKPAPMDVSLGITDNRSTEIVGGELKAGDQVIVGDAQAANGAPSSSSAPRMRMF